MERKMLVILRRGSLRCPWDGSASRVGEEDSGSSSMAATLRQHEGVGGDGGVIDDGVDFVVHVPQVVINEGHKVHRIAEGGGEASNVDGGDNILEEPFDARGVVRGLEDCVGVQG
eukprot:1146620-Ditylum_brightwellii.AAC.1